FAGPGEYEQGEEGSPLIAVEALVEHSYKSKIINEVVFVFIEKDSKRFDHLKATLERKYPQLPKHIKIELHNGAFDETLTSILELIDQQNRQLAPCFAMIDPFGVSDTPMKLIERILKNDKAEIYLSLMYSYINRFKKSAEFEPHLNELFGTREWQVGAEIEDQRNRKVFFYDFYAQQLKNAGANQVMHLDLYRGNELVYGLFFATKHIKGCDKMKQAMWRIAPVGDYQFKGNSSAQFAIGLDDVDYGILQKQLDRRFKEKGWIYIQDVLNYVASDETIFHSGHVKTKGLKPLEALGKIEVDENTRRRKMSYPDGCRLRFLGEHNTVNVSS
ncbi:MAG: three-Cys-motif partner protein TcmP, partial [Gammaproteobacteria bacterium]|nr:three-Cys-motif partner protein TcmP [Gammaproteobacteria bacterium]